MKQIIEGRRYNTETAEEVARYHNGCGTTDFNYIFETLYRTKKGNFFLHGEGGAATTYARHVGNGNRTGSEKIIPLSDDETVEWLESHGHTDAIEQYFPDYVEDA